MVNPHLLSFCPVSLSRPVFRPHPALSSDTQSAVLASHVLRAARYFAAGERGSGCFCARTRGGPRRTLVPGDSGGRGHRGAGSLLRGDERSAGEEQAETVQPCKQFWWDSHACFGPFVLSQVNPALTLALLATRRLDVLRALVYITAQCLGACLGAGALYLALPLKTTAEHFVNKVSSGVVDPERSAASRPSAALSGPLLPPPGPPAAERGPGSGCRGAVHLPDGLHRLLCGGAAPEGEPRTRKPGHRLRPLRRSAAGGEEA